MVGASKWRAARRRRRAARRVEFRESWRGPAGPRGAEGLAADIAGGGVAVGGRWRSRAELGALVVG
eukprot:1607588-Lingulodinium_polyedra.AAC.1